MRSAKWKVKSEVRSLSGRVLGGGSVMTGRTVWRVVIVGLALVVLAGGAAAWQAPPGGAESRMRSFYDL